MYDSVADLDPYLENFDRSGILFLRFRPLPTYSLSKIDPTIFHNFFWLTLQKILVLKNFCSTDPNRVIDMDWLDQDPQHCLL